MNGGKNVQKAGWDIEDTEAHKNMFPQQSLIQLYCIQLNSESTDSSNLDQLVYIGNYFFWGFLTFYNLQS